MTVPLPFADMIMNGVFRHYGVAHFLFHPAHSTIPEVADAMLYVLAQGKARGLEWWTARDISAWERARRTSAWSAYASEGKDGHGKAAVTFRTERPLKDATVLWLAPNETKTKIDGKRRCAQRVERWGVPFAAATSDLLPGTDHKLALTW